MTLRDLVNEYGANGVIRIDAGNGSAGPCFLPWDEVADDLGDTEMVPIADAALDNDARLVMDDETYVVIYASDWIEDDDRNAPYQASNPWRYRIIF